jgi:hypothetical protein
MRGFIRERAEGIGLGYNEQEIKLFISHFMVISRLKPPYFVSRASKIAHTTLSRVLPFLRKLCTFKILDCVSAHPNTFTLPHHRYPLLRVLGRPCTSEISGNICSRISLYFLGPSVASARCFFFSAGDMFARFSLSITGAARTVSGAWKLCDVLGTPTGSIGLRPRLVKAFARSERRMRQVKMAKCCSGSKRV